MLFCLVDFSYSLFREVWLEAKTIYVTKKIS